MRIGLKNVQTCEGREGMACSATLYIDGKKAGRAFDAANGGELRIDSIAKPNPATVKAFRELQNDPRLTGAIKALIAKDESQRWLKGKCRTKTLFKLDTDGDDDWSVCAAPFSESLKTALEQKYGNRLKVFGNELCKEPLEGELDELAQDWKKQLDDFGVHADAVIGSEICEFASKASKQQ